MPRLFHDPEYTIRQLVSALHELQQQHEWVYWSALARRLTGSQEYTAEVQGLAELQDYSQFFSMRATGAVVRLSPAGLAFATEIGATIDASGHAFGERVGRAVRRYAGQLEPEVVSVTDCLAKTVVSGSNIVHAFRAGGNENFIATETPLRFQSATSRFTCQGKLVGQDKEGEILFATLSSEVMPVDMPGRLLVDKSFLLAQLANRLELLAACPPLLPAEAVPGPACQHDNSVELAGQLLRLAAPWTRLLWGPPGGGKTHGVAYLVSRLLHHDSSERILIVAPSNKAVDVAFWQVVQRIIGSGNTDLISSRKVFRFGYARDEAILASPELLGPAGHDDLAQKVRQAACRLAESERAGRKPEEVAVLRAELFAIQEQLKQAVAAHLLHARVVGTTTALGYASGVGASVWTTVIVDEVTMVPVAVLAFFASLATRRLLLAGDPNQLGPVYENNGQLTAHEQEWMGKDVFDWCGIVGHHNGHPGVNLDDPRLARINRQRRCPPELWQWVSEYYPAVTTETGCTLARSESFATLVLT